MTKRQPHRQFRSLPRRSSPGLPPLLAGMNEAIALLNPLGQIVATNDLAAEILQIPKGRLRGQFWKSFVNTAVDFSQCYRGQQPHSKYISLRRAGGRQQPKGQGAPQTLEWSLTREILPRRHLVVFRDISDRTTPAEAALVRQQDQAELFAEVTLKIRQSLQLSEILQATVTEIQRLLKADRVLAYQVLADGTGKPISEAVLPQHPAILGMTFPEEVFPSDYQRRYAQGRVVAIPNVRDPAAGLADCLVEFVEQFGIRAKLIVPILQSPRLASSPGLAAGSSLGQGTDAPPSLWGLLIAHQCNAPRQWSAEELALMQQLADQISIAIAQSQLVENLEEMVVLRTTALAQREEQLRLITNALPVLIAYIDREQRYRFNNQAYATWLGRSPQQLKGLTLETVWQATSYERMRLPIQRVLAGEEVTFENELTAQDGQTRTLNVTYIPDFGPQNQVQGFFALTSDISDRKAIERMKDEFISVVSHELRTPLTSMHSALKILSTGRLGLLSQDGQQMLEIADENTERLVRLVNSVLDLQRIESGDITMEKRLCDAASLIVQAIEAMQPMAQQQGIRLLLDQPSALKIWADADYMLQALTNLMSNAIKFSQAGSQVSIAVEAQAGQTLFRIRDQGPGIPAEKLESIFERFQQVDSSDARRKGGTGLGLTICREIIEQHGGRIWAESELGHGSTFCFTVPPPPLVEGEPGGGHHGR